MQLFSDTVQDRYGNGQSGIQVTVKVDGVTADLYADVDGTTLANPVTTGADGQVTFYYAKSGTYSFWVDGVQVDERSLIAKVLQLDVHQFGAKGNGTDDDWQAIINAQTALANEGGGELLFNWQGDYLVRAEPILMVPGIMYRGFGRSATDLTTKRGARIRSDTGSIFRNDSNILAGMSFRGLWLESEVGGGDIFDWSDSGLVAKVDISRCILAQRNADKRIINGTAAGGVFTVNLHDFEYVYKPECSVPPLYFASDTINSLTIANFWSTANGQDSTGEVSIHVESTNPSGAAFNVNVRNGVFELPASGSIKLLSCSQSSIEDCTTYDLSIPAGAPQFSIDKGAGPAPSHIAIRRCRSTIGNSSAPDLYINTANSGSGAFVVENCFFQYGDGGSTLPGSQITLINSTIVNKTNLNYLELGYSADAQIKFGNTEGTSKEYQLWNGYSGNGDGYFHFYQNATYIGAFSPTGLFQWGGSRSSPAFYVTQGGDVFARNSLFPGTLAGADQNILGLNIVTGAPSNAYGQDGWIVFRSDGGAGTTIYQKRAGAWVGIV